MQPTCWHTRLVSLSQNRTHLCRSPPPPQVRAAAADTLDTVGHLIPVFLSDIAKVCACVCGCGWVGVLWVCGLWGCGCVLGVGGAVDWGVITGG